jgi:hypothetical protein
MNLGRHTKVLGGSGQCDKLSQVATWLDLKSLFYENIISLEEGQNQWGLRNLCS